MKTAIAVSTPDARFSALALKDGFERSVAKVTELGFDGVELAIRDPGAVDIPALERVLKATGLPVPAIGTGQAFGTDGLSFSSPDIKIRKAALERVKSHIDLAAKLGSKVIIGLVHGGHTAGIPYDVTLSWVKDAMASLAGYAEGMGVELVLEPINRYETDLINTVDDALAFLDSVGAPNISLLVDTFHMNIEEASIEGSIRRAKGRIGHVHVADSNRWAPGLGHIDFQPVLDALIEIGYNGFLSAEILPMPTSEEALLATARWMERVKGKEV
ncbi:MAG: sugar phosphate isomerase/epimerase [Firmicutes bacterium]|nr:sugar phosphate isomerase/epimerase [Bacillota bacterium]